MRFPYLLAFAIMLTTAAFAQPKSRSLSFAGGRSFHGTGDMKGLQFAFEYGNQLERRLRWSLAMTHTIHYKEDVLRTTGGPVPVQEKNREVKTGVQLGGFFEPQILATARHSFGIGLGPLLRYQFASNTSVYRYYPSSPPVWEREGDNEQNGLAAGYQVRLKYDFSMSERLRLGAQLGFQNDTHADVITYYALQLSHKF
jgi:hypothetical protein